MKDRTLTGVNWTYVLVGVTDATILPFIPLLLLERGLTASQIGLVLGVCAAASFAVGLGWAYLADRRLSPERLVIVAAASASAVALLLAVQGGGLVAALVIVALSIARSPFILLDPIALRRLRAGPRTDYARVRLRMSAGWAASSVASGAMLQGVGLRLLPFFYAPLSALLGLWVWRSLKPAPDIAASKSTESAGLKVRVPRVPPAFAGFLVSCFFLGASLAATQNFLTLQIDLLGGGALLVGAAGAFQALTEIPTMAYIHVMTRRLDHRVLFAIGCGIYLVIFIAWAFVADALIAALLKLVAGVAFALILVAAVMITSELVPARLRATGQALTKAILFGVAPILGSLGGGVVYQALGPRAMFLAAAGVVGLAAATALAVMPGRARSAAKGLPTPAPEAAPSIP